MKNKAVTGLVEFIQLAGTHPTPIAVWLSIPGSLISGHIATYEDYTEHTANPFGSKARSSPPDGVMWLHDVSVIAGGRTVYMPFCCVDLEQVAAWGFGLIE